MMLKADMSHLPTVTVVIAAQARPKELRGALTSVRSQVLQPVEIIVVASGNFDSEIPSIASAFAARLIEDRRGGLNRARNLAARASSADVVAYMDDDSVARPDWTRALAEEFVDPDVVAVAGQVRPPEVDGVPDERLESFLQMSTFGGDSKIVVDRDTDDWFEITAFGGVGIGTNMAFRTSVFRWWTGFDERVGAGTVMHGGEEGIAFRQLVEKGGTVVYTPLARVHHPTVMPSFPEIARRYAMALSAQSAYMVMLFAETRPHRRRILRFVGEGLLRKQRRWRPVMRSRFRPPISLIRRLGCYLYGPLVYFRIRDRKLPEEVTVVDE